MVHGLWFCVWVVGFKFADWIDEIGSGLGEEWMGLCLEWALGGLRMGMGVGLRD